MIAETLEYFVIAFISSAVLIVLSKIILQNLIRRPADYYLAEELKQEEMMLNSAGLSITEEIETNPEGEMTSEHISVTPRFTVDETVDMHLIEREKVPERFIEESDHIKQSVDDIRENANAASDEMKEIFRDFPESPELSGSSETPESPDEGSDKAGSDTDSIPEMDELREIILGSAQAEADTFETDTKADTFETDSEADTSETRAEADMFEAYTSEAELKTGAGEAESAETESAEAGGVANAAEAGTESGIAKSDEKAGKNPKEKKDLKENKDTKEKKEKKDKGKGERKRGRYPSIKMRKDELLAMAAERGIDVPDHFTKKEIIELINANESEDNKSRNKNGNNRNKDGNNRSRNKNNSNRNRKKKEDSGAKNNNNKKNTNKKQEQKQNKNQKQDKKQEK